MNLREMKIKVGRYKKLRQKTKMFNKTQRNRARNKVARASRKANR